MSLTKYLQHELFSRKNIRCPLLRLDNLTSLQECHQNLADTVVNVSRLAFDNLAAIDLNITLHNDGIHKQFSKEKIHSYLPNSETYGLLSPRQYFIFDGYQTQVVKFSFPDSIIQEFWAAFHTVSMQTDISNYDASILFLNKPYLYFLCGLYHLNATLLSQSLKMLLINFQNKTEPGLLNDISMCGFESKLSRDVLANTLMNLFGSELHLDLDHVEFYSLYMCILKYFTFNLCLILFNK